MEKRQLRRSASTTDEWIKCQSKTHPGQYYLFNKKTGETEWCNEARSNSTSPKTQATSQNQPPPKWTITKSSLRTPAQDRLKRLQTSFKSKQTKEKLNQKQELAHRTRSNLTVAAQLKKENIDKNHNITATTSKDVVASTSGSVTTVKRESTPTPSATVISAKTPKNVLSSTPKKIPKRLTPKKETKKRASTSSLSIANSPTKLIKRPKMICPQNNQSSTKEEREDEEKDEHHVYPCTSAAINLGSGIVNKIKEICKSTLNTYNSAKKVLGQRALEPCIKKTNLKIPTKELVPINNNSSKSSNTHLIQDALEKRKEQEQQRQQAVSSSAPVSVMVKATAVPNDAAGVMDFKAIAVATTPLKRYSTTHPFTPAYERGSANSRLERLRISLQQQAAAENSLLSTPTSRLCASACSSALACVINSDGSAEEQRHDDDIEAMDWTSTEDVKPVEISSSSEASFVLSTITNQDTKSIGEYYDTVNENLLRFSVEQKQDEKAIFSKWLTDHYYFVLDTNVLLQYLTFIEDLSLMKLCDTSGTVLYVPYSVLQELDKLKQFARGDGTKVLAVRAIKYLNAKFEAKDKHIQAQSATSELEHLIEVCSPDDRIINCCLQVKQHVDHVILLTEDINLRNKAICNNILVSTKSDLISKRF